MPSVNIFEWEGSYAISGSISPALPAETAGQVVVRASTADDRISFQAAPGDSIDQVDVTTSDITINVPGGSDSFLIPVDITNTDEEEGDLAVDLTILSFTVGGGSVATAISSDAELEVVIVDDEVEAVMSKGEHGTEADNDTPVYIPLTLDRAVAEDVVVSVTATPANGLTAADFSVPASVTFVGNDNLASGEDSQTEAIIPVVIGNPTAAGTINLTASVSQGNATGLVTAQITVTGTGATVTAQFATTAPITRSETQEGNLGLTIVFSQITPADGTLEFSVSPSPDARLVNSDLGQNLDSTFTVAVPANTSSVILPVEVIDAPGEQGDETFIFTLVSFTPNSNLFLGGLGAYTTKSVTLLDDEVPAIVSIYSPDDAGTILEGFDTVVTASLDRPVADDTIVQIAQVGGTAVIGVDFELDNRLTIPAGQTQVTTDAAGVFAIDTCRPNRTLEIDGVVVGGNYASFGSLTDTLSFTVSGDGNPVYIQFSGGVYNATEGGPFELYFSASQLLEEEVAANVLFPSERFPGLASEDYEVDILLPVGVSSYTWQGTIPNTSTTQQSGEVTFTLQSVQSTVAENISTPLLGPDVTSEVFVTDNDIDANIQFTQGSMNLTAGDTSSATLVSDRPVSDDVVIAITVGGATASDIINEPATVTMLAGETTVSFNFDVDPAATAGVVTINAGLVSGPAVINTAGGLNRIVVTVDSAPVTNSVIALDSPGTITDFDEWVGGSVNFTGTITPPFPVGGSVVVSSIPNAIGGGVYASDTRITFQNGASTSGITIPVGAGVGTFDFDVFVSGNDIADAATLTKISRIAITDATSTSHAVTIPPADNYNSKFIKITDDDIATDMAWSIDTTSVLVDDTTGQDLTITVTLDHGVSGDTDFEFGYTWREAYVGGSVTTPTITIPANSTTATGIVNVSAGTYQDFQITLSAVTGAGASLIIQDATDQAPIVITAPDAPVPPGVALGAPSQIVHKLPSHSYFGTIEETGAYDSYITNTPNYLLQTVVPIDPVLEADLPYFTIDGNPADVFPATWTHDDKVDTVHVVAPADTSYVFESVDLSLTSNSTEGSGILEQVDSPGTFSVSINPIDLSQLKLSIGLDNGSEIVRVETKTLPNWIEVEHELAGNYIDRKHYWTQFEVWPAGNAPTGYSSKVLGVHAWVTQRSDVNACEVEFVIANDVYDDTIGNRDADHPEVNGDVWFWDIKIHAPAGYKAWEGGEYFVDNQGNMQIRETDLSIHNGQQYLVRPLLTANPASYIAEANRGTCSMHVLPRRNKIMRRLSIARGTNEGRALALWLNRMGGMGVALPMAYDAGKPLGNNYQAKRGYAAQRDYLPAIDFDTTVNYNGSDPFWNNFGTTGREVHEARVTGTLMNMRSGARGFTKNNPLTGENGHYVAGWELYGDTGEGIIRGAGDITAYSWYRPLWNKWSREYGGRGILPRSGYDQHNAQTELSYLQIQYCGQRNRKTLTNLQGQIVRAETLAVAAQQAHGLNEPTLPWLEDYYYDNNGGAQHPWFFGPFVDKDSLQPGNPNGQDLNANPPLAPTNRLWNNPPAGVDTVYMSVEQAASTGNAHDQWLSKCMFFDGRTADVRHYESWDGEHHFRLEHSHQAPIWFANNAVAKWSMQQEASHIEQCASQYPVMDDYTHNGITWDIAGSDRFRRNSFRYMAEDGQNMIGNSVGNLISDRNHGESILCVAQGLRTVKPGAWKTQLKTEWFPYIKDAVKNTLTPHSFTKLSNNYVEGKTWGNSTWDSTWQELVYLEPGLSGYQDIYDLGDAEFLLECDRRIGQETTGNQPTLSCNQELDHAYFGWGMLGVLETFEGCDPTNPGEFHQILMGPLAYHTYRVWQHMDRRRSLLAPQTSGLDRTTEEYFRKIGQEEYTFNAPPVMFVHKADGYPMLDYAAWHWDPSQFGTGSVANSHAENKDMLTLGMAYRMTGDRRFLEYAKYFMFRPYRNCVIPDSTWTSITGNISGDFQSKCNTLDSDVCPSSIEGARRLWSRTTVGNQSHITEDGNDGPAINDAWSTHLAPIVGEMTHQDWNETYAPTAPPDHARIMATAWGQAYKALATGNSGGVGFPEGTKKATDVVADFVFSGTTVTDNVSSLTISDAGTGSVTLGTNEGVDFVNLSNARMDIPASDADLILEALKATGTDQVTFEFWLRPFDVTNEGPARIMSWSHTATPTGTANAQVTMSKWNNDSNYWGHLGAKTWNQARYAAGNLYELEQGQLNHVVLSIDGLNCSGWVNTYNNTGGTQITQHIGNLTPWTPAALGRVISGWTEGHTITIGDEKDGQLDTRHLNAEYYRMSIYKSVFTEADVSANFYAGPDADLGVVTVTTPAKATFTTSIINEAEDADQKTIRVNGSYNKPLDSSTTLTVSANIPAAETRLTAPSFTANTLDIDLDAGESTFFFDLLMTSATGDQGTQNSVFTLVSDSGADSEVGTTSSVTVQLVDGTVPGGSGGTGGGGQGSGGSTGGGTGSTVTEITSPNGITWFFDQPVEAGQFVGGDWWVVGPVSVTAIDPSPSSWIEGGEQRYANGSMIDIAVPSGLKEVAGHYRTDSDDRDFTVDVSAMTFDTYNGFRPGRTQGFVNAWGGTAGDGSYNWENFYDHTLNAAYPNGQVLGANNPIVLQPGQTLNSSWTMPLSPYDVDSTDTFGVYVDGQHVRDLPMNATPRSHSNQLIRNDGQSAAENVIRTIEALTVVEEVPPGYSGGGSGGGGLSTVYRGAMLPTRMSLWYVGKQQYMQDANNNSFPQPIWDECKNIGIGTVLRGAPWMNKELFVPGNTSFTESSFEAYDGIMKQVGVISMGLSGETIDDLHTSYNKNGEGSRFVYEGPPLLPEAGGGNCRYGWVGFSRDDWPIPFSYDGPNGDPVGADYWMLGHEPELSRFRNTGGDSVANDDEITPYDLNDDGTPKWTLYDPTKSYSAGDRVFMIDTQSSFSSLDTDGNPVYNANTTMYGRMEVFEARVDVDPGQAPRWDLIPGYTDQYFPNDNTQWMRVFRPQWAKTNWGHGWPAAIIKERAEAFKAAYPEKKLYFFFSKGVCVAGWNGIDYAVRPGKTDPEFGLYDDQLSYFSAIASIDAFDGFMFDYYPWNAFPTGRVGSNNVDPPAVYQNPVNGIYYIDDDPKWVVSGVHRIKEWSKGGDFPNGKPVYPTLPATPNFLSAVGADNVNSNPTADGFMAYYDFDRPDTQQMKDLVTSCVDAGADGFVWYTHAWGRRVKEGASAPWTPGDIQPTFGSELATFWPFAWKDWQGAGGAQIDKYGNPRSIQGKYFPDIPNVDVSGDGSWEMMTEVCQHILSLLPELDDTTNPGAIIPPTVDSPPPSNSGGWFRPSPMDVEASQKEPRYHTSSVDEWLATGPFANLTAPITWNHDYFMTPAPLGYPLDDTNSTPGGMTEVPNPENYYYLLPDGSKQVYWNPNGKNRVTATNQAVTDNVYTIHQTFNSDRQQYTYGSAIMNRNDSVMLALNSDLAPDKKRDILIHYLQWGIDLDAMYRSGMRWPPNGDHNNGRYTPILLKRIVFGESLADLYAQDFSENRQAYIIPDRATANFHVCQSENANATYTTSGDCTRYQVGYDWEKNGPPTDGLAIAADGSHNIQGKPFTEEQVGRTAWIQWGWPPFRGDQTKNLTADQKNPKYLSQTAKVGHGQAVGWRAMGMMNEYDAPQFFNSIDQKNLLGQDYPYYVDDNGDPINQQKRGINGGWLGGIAGSVGRQRTAILYDLWRPIVGPDYSVSSVNIYNSSGLAFNTYSNRPANAADGYPSLSAVLNGPFPGSNPPGGGTGGGGTPGTGGGTGAGADLGEVGTNPFYAGVGEEGRGAPYLYPPAIDDSATHPDGVINGANTGHRLWLSAMTVSAIPTTGDSCYTFANTGDCGGYSHCTEVPAGGLVVSGVVFSAVDSYAHNSLIEIDNNMNHDLSFVDCLFIGQEHYFQRYSDNGGTVNTAELGNSTKNVGNKYHFNSTQSASPNTIDNVHLLWSSFRGVGSKILNIPVRTFKRLNFDWYAADAVNVYGIGDWEVDQIPLHMEECWWGTSTHVRGFRQCNPTDHPELFDCTQQSTYGGYDVENCKPIRYTQCGHFAYGWTWEEGAEVHCDSYQNVKQDIEEMRFTKCVFGANPTLWQPRNAASWDYRMPVNQTAKYSPLYHKAEYAEQRSLATLDGHPAPIETSFACIHERYHDKNYQMNGNTARHKRHIFDRCHYLGSGSSYHSAQNNKYSIDKGSDNIKRWRINGCPEPWSPLYPGGGPDPAAQEAEWELYDTRYYNPTRCKNDDGFNLSGGSHYIGGPVEFHFSGCTFSVANKSQLWQLNSDQNLDIPIDVLMDLVPNPVSTAAETAQLSSCDELRAAGYTEANGWTSMAQCPEGRVNFDSKVFITDGNNKFIDVETAETCNNIRMNDGTDVYGSINPAFSCEDMIQGNPLVGNDTSIINILNAERKSDWTDYSVYDDTFINPDEISLQTGTNEFPAYIYKPFTSRERCQCED